MLMFQGGDIHEDYCAVCGRSGELLMCDTCSLVYHLGCLDPPLNNIPHGLWSCPKCFVSLKHLWTENVTTVSSSIVITAYGSSIHGH